MVGVSDLIVVASGKDVLVLPRGRSQEVKALLEAMKSAGQQGAAPAQLERTIKE